MALVSMNELLAQAEADTRAVGAFNVANMEMLIGIVRAAESCGTGIILQIAQGRLKHTPLAYIGPMMVQAAKESSVPIAVHLDHGKTDAVIRSALELGFTSVMFDGSALPLTENIARTQAVLAVAKQYGASVEAELGCIGGNEGEAQDSAVKVTDVESVGVFLAQVSVDALAIAIGNAHGHYRGKPQLCFEVLTEIAQKHRVPLVLHGGSGISDAEFQRCIDCGIRKINIATASFDAFMNACTAYLHTAENPSYFGLNEAVVEACYHNAMHHITVFNNNK